MSSYYDTFGNGPETYDDDPDGVEVERREVEEDQQRHPERYESRRVLIVPGSRSEQLLHYPANQQASQVDDLAKLQVSVRAIREDYRELGDFAQHRKLDARLNKVEADLGDCISRARGEKMAMEE